MKDFFKTLIRFIPNFFRFYFYYRWKKGDLDYNRIHEQPYVSYKINKWMTKQKKERNITESKSGSFNELKMLWYHARMLALIKYVSDEKQWYETDYWMTYDEIDESRKGDCEDQACYCMMDLRDAGFGDDILGMLWIPGHMLCMVQDKENDFWVLNNGGVPKRASYYFEEDEEGTRILVAFNLFKRWKYPNY